VFSLREYTLIFAALQMAFRKKAAVVDDFMHNKVLYKEEKREGW
jgi:hypothetical protein